MNAYSRMRWNRYDTDWSCRLSLAFLNDLEDKISRHGSPRCFVFYLADSFVHVVWFLYPWHETSSFTCTLSSRTAVFYDVINTHSGCRLGDMIKGQWFTITMLTDNVTSYMWRALCSDDRSTSLRDADGMCRNGLPHQHSSIQPLYSISANGATVSYASTHISMTSYRNTQYTSYNSAFMTRDGSECQLCCFS